MYIIFSYTGHDTTSNNRDIDIKLYYSVDNSQPESFEDMDIISLNNGYDAESSVTCDSTTDILILDDDGSQNYYAAGVSIDGGTPLTVFLSGIDNTKKAIDGNIYYLCIFNIESDDTVTISADSHYTYIPTPAKLDVTIINDSTTGGYSENKYKYINGTPHKYDFDGDTYIDIFTVSSSYFYFTIYRGDGVLYSFPSPTKSGKEPLLIFEKDTNFTWSETKVFTVKTECSFEFLDSPGSSETYEEDVYDIKKLTIKFEETNLSNTITNDTTLFNETTGGSYSKKWGTSDFIITININSNSSTKYTITYKLDGATSYPTGYSDGQIYTVVSGGTHPVALNQTTAKLFGKTGYTFNGFKDLYNTSYKCGNIIENISKNYTLTALWVSNTNTYTVNEICDTNYITVNLDAADGSYTDKTYILSAKYDDVKQDLTTGTYTINIEKPDWVTNVELVKLSTNGLSEITNNTYYLLPKFSYNANDTQVTRTGNITFTFNTYSTDRPITMMLILEANNSVKEDASLNVGDVDIYTSTHFDVTLSGDHYVATTSVTWHVSYTSFILPILVTCSVFKGVWDDAYMKSEPITIKQSNLNDLNRYTVTMSFILNTISDVFNFLTNVKYLSATDDTDTTVNAYGFNVITGRASVGFNTIIKAS